MLRLDKVISNQLGISRKDVKSAVKKGQASVNGVTVRDSGLLVDPEKDLLLFCGSPIEFKEHIYIVMNKPKGILSASCDKSRKTVVDIVPRELYRSGLFPAGRLDKDTTGLLIITDDGDFAHKILSPKNHIFKTYIAGLDGEITADTVKMFENGITLADGSVCRAAELKDLGGGFAEIKICEGKYHQIKRMFGVAGLGVNSLERVAMGGYKLPETLAAGECFEVKKTELEAIFSKIL